MADSPQAAVLLVATVGGSPEPLVASILHWKPQRILFVPSVTSADQVDGIRSALQGRGHELPPGTYEAIPVSDPQDLAKCVREMRRGLEEDAARWCGRGAHFRCVVDFTGGTKCMTAALSNLARYWPRVEFSFVGGRVRDKGGVGIVQSGSEQVVSAANPWAVFGHQAVEDAIVAFDHHDYHEGAAWLRAAIPKVRSDPARASELSALATFVEGYDLWDRTEYSEAYGKFGQCSKKLNDLSAALLHMGRERLRTHVGAAREKLEALKRDTGRPTRALLEDLLANAARRKDEGRHVDAVARLYRAIELAAQLRLLEDFGIRTAAVPVAELPETLADSVKWRAADGSVTLGLQDAYALLRHRGDPLGERFFALNWNGPRSPLARRNDSIAGHGFAPVPKETCAQLWEGALALAGLRADEVFQFPTLGLGRRS